MVIFPAIDILGGNAVRLYKGDYSEVTVYDKDPLCAALRFSDAGATHIHIVDLEGARSGVCSCAETVARISRETGMFIEVGGGIRSRDTVEELVSCGVSRVILGTAAVQNRELLSDLLNEYGEAVAVGADIKDGFIAVKGWLESSGVSAEAFFADMESLGVKNIICTDISRDGAMHGTNLELYRELSLKYKVDITASGGVSSLEDVRALSEMGVYGAIIGKALYTGAVDLAEALKI